MVELRKVREAADEEKATKTSARKAKALVKEEQLRSHPKNTPTTTPPQSKTKVLISDEVTVHTVENNPWADEGTEAIGDVGIEGEAERTGGASLESRTLLPAWKWVNKAWERAQKDRYIDSL